jgi:hypothetical protein
MKYYNEIRILSLNNMVHEEQGMILDGMQSSSDKIIITSHKLPQQYWQDNRLDKGKVRVRYIDRGAPEDRSCVSGPVIWPEPY